MFPDRHIETYSAVGDPRRSECLSKAIHPAEARLLYCGKTGCLHLTAEQGLCKGPQQKNLTHSDIGQTAWSRL